MGVLWHQSGVNKNGEPFIQLFQDEQIICQLDPQQARDHAHAVLEAAEASEQDAFILDFFSQKVGADKNHAMMLVVEFRKWREAKGKKGPPSDRSEFVRTEKHEKPPEESNGK